MSAQKSARKRRVKIKAKIRVKRNNPRKKEIVSRTIEALKAVYRSLLPSEPRAEELVLVPSEIHYETLFIDIEIRCTWHSGVIVCHATGSVRNQQPCEEMVKAYRELTSWRDSLLLLDPKDPVDKKTRKMIERRISILKDSIKKLRAECWKTYFDIVSEEHVP